LDIAEINSFSHPLAIDVTQQILETMREKVKEKHVAEQQVITIQKEAQKKIYNDPRLSRAKNVVEWIFDRIPTILDSLQGQLESDEIKHISELQEGLKKLRMGNNYEKIRDLAEDVLRWMQRMELFSLSLHSDQAQFIIP